MKNGWEKGGFGPWDGRMKGSPYVYRNTDKRRRKKGEVASTAVQRER